MLTPWHTSSRYAVVMNWRNTVRLTKIYWKRFASPVALATGLLLGAFVMLVYRQPVIQQPISGSAQLVAPGTASPVQL